MKYRSYSLTDIGYSRKRNEDYLLIQDNLFLVADGCGGHSDGNIASELACKSFAQDIVIDENINDLDIIKKCLESHNALKNVNPDMATTLSGVIILKNNCITFNIGDSPIFGIRKNHICDLYQNHSYWGGVLFKCIGRKDFDRPFFLKSRIYPGDKIIICSDGLTKHIPKNEILDIANKSSESSLHNHLKTLALKDGGSDNITIITIFIE